MTSNDRLNLTDPADTAALVPYLLGHHPHDRLVILALRQHRLHFLAAADLPYTAPAGADVVAVVADTQPDQILLYGYGDHDTVTTAVDHTTAGFTAARIPVLDAFRVHDNRIWHLHCHDPHCDYDGTPFDPDNTVAAAFATYHGLTAATDIQALDARLDPVTGAERDAMTLAYHRAHHQLLRLTDGPDAADRLHLLLEELLTETRSAYRTGRLCDTRAALLTVLLDVQPLRHHAVRQIPADELHLRIWTDLTRRASPAYTAAPATMLAVAAIQLGEGTLARLAIQRAQHAAPTDPLITVIAECIRYGVHPDTVRRILHD
ncbi:DUF4192 domain-containing protein [Actinoplanes subglobosus]|uniref:DUF4192 domain-containing protein n=1 Tax=Actinoplanes subglobosus TaxID=1547892 RepID=A0ABV8J5M9_9ACTN